MDSTRNRFDEWVRRGDLEATPAAVCPGTKKAGAWAWWSRGTLQAWAWRRVQRYTGGRVGLAVDLGCGYGDWTERIATISEQVIATDVAPGFVAQTRARLAAIGHRRFEVTCGDVRDFVDYDGADLVHLGGVLMYLDDTEATRVLARVRDRLSAGGVVHQRDWCAVNFGRATRQTRNGLFSIHRTPADCVAIARTAGLRLLEVRRSASIYGEQAAYHSIGLRHERLTRWTRWLPTLPVRLVTALWPRASVSFFFARD